MYNHYDVKPYNQSWLHYTVTIIDDDFVESIVIDSRQHNGDPNIERVITDAIIQIYSKKNLDVALNLYRALKEIQMNYPINDDILLQIEYCMGVPSFELYRIEVEKYHQRMLNLKAFW